jgi:hypothetical protein
VAETETVGGSRLDASEENGFVIIDNRAERESRADSGEIDFTITDERTARQRRAQESASVGVEQPLPRQRKCSVCGEAGHTARTCPSVGAADRATRAPRASGSALSPAAPVILGTINLTVTNLFGENCSVSEKELSYMVPAMQRMMERMPAAAAQKAAVWIDPVVLFSCFILWGGRIRAIKAEESRIAYNVTPYEQARANGAAGSEYRVPTNQQNGAVYNGPSTTMNNINAAAADRAQQSESDMPAEPTSNGVPQSIREAFDDRI